MDDELTDYPLTGRFMAGRIRREMSDGDKRALEDAVETVETFQRPHRIVERGNVYEHSTILIEGYVLRTMDGPERRHGLAIHVPGDFVDLHCFALKRLDHNIDTAGPTRLGYIPHATLRQIVADLPNLTRILWFATLIDAAIHREWVMKLEQLTVPRRLAHIFAETWRRLGMVGLGDESGFTLPLTQAHLGELSGATTIHVNRALKELREADVAHFARGRIDIPDRARLEEWGRFGGDYLYGEGALAHGGVNA